MIFEDGKGTGSKARVDSTNKLHTRAITETTELHEIVEGDGYNINTGNISFTAAGTLLYIKNNENRDLILSTLIVGVGTGSTSDMGEVTISRDPTGGDLASDATAVSINQNRLFGSSKTLSADVYKGKSGGTNTGDTDIVLIYSGTNTRVVATLNLVIPKGRIVTIEYDPKLSSGSVKAYAAAICFLANSNSTD